MLREILAILARWDAQASAQIALTPDQHQQRRSPYWLAQVGAHLGDSWLWAIVVLFEWWRVGANQTPGIFPVAKVVYASTTSATQTLGSSRARLLGYWMLTLFIAQCTNLLIKQMAKRTRPGTAHFLYGFGPDEYSFPSGHAMRMGVIAVWGQRLWPTWGWLAWPLALWVSWSRVRLGIHYVGDIAAGLGLGGLIAWGLLGRQNVDNSDSQ